MHRIYLNVPYAEKDQAKACGARWDAKNKSWYVNDSSFFEKHPDLNQWRPSRPQPTRRKVVELEWEDVWQSLRKNCDDDEEITLNSPIPLGVAYEERGEVKALGAIWDNDLGCWFVWAEGLLKEKDLLNWIPEDIRDEVDLLMEVPFLEQELKAAAEKRKNAARKRWKERAPRFETAEELLKMLDLDPKKIGYASGFCGMCDSRTSGLAMLTDDGKFGNELRHIAHFDGYKFGPLSTSLNPAEYQIVEDYFEARENKTLEEKSSTLTSTEVTPGENAHRKITVSQLSQLGKCEQQLVYDSNKGERRSKEWTRKGEQGQRVHEAYEAQLNNSSDPTLAGSDKRCFIATASFGPEAIEVRQLRNFRDEFLLKSYLGRIFVNLYYASSPKMAEWLDTKPKALDSSRKALKALIWILKFIGAVR